MRLTIFSLLLAALALAAVTGCSSEADRLYRHAKDAAEEEGDYEAALRYVDQAIERSPEEGRFHRRRGDWLRELGRLEEALEAYDQAVSAPNPSQSAQLKAISTCIALGRADEAQERIDRARVLLVEPDDIADLEEFSAEVEQMRSGATEPAAVDQP